MDISFLTIGMSVQIQRSDGRVHGAGISAVNKDTQFVSVEWFENGETKGKEIFLKQIYDLNSELFVREPAESAAIKPPSKHEQKQHVSSKSSSDRRTMATPREGQNRGKQQLEKDNAISDALPLIRKLQQPKGIPVPKEDPSRRNGSEFNGQGLLAVKQPRQNRVAELQQDVVTEQPFSKEKPVVAKSRVSSCLKEVEKLKKNREERRAKQAEQLAERNEDNDTSNPNWEFLKKIRDFQMKLLIQPLIGDEPIVQKKICVCVRKRPLNSKELRRKEVDVITVADKSSVLVHEPKTKVDLTKFLENQKFVFDYSFNDTVTNDIVYRFTAQPLVHTIFNRGMATCFAYGQTGSGKTHTMGGEFQGKDQNAMEGIYALAASDVFRLISQPANAKKGLAVFASFFEIYSGKVFDLLNSSTRLRILEDGKQQVQIVGLTETTVNNVRDVIRLIQTGSKCRASGTTSANQNSSRSHAVFQIILRKRSSCKLFGKFSLIDLAGNERGADTASSDRKTRMEGAEINKSLLALKECIRALSSQGAHLPFRGSKLTQVLKDSFVGENSRTCMIAMISPGLNSCEHTLNTLRYADRVKELKRSSVTSDGSGADPKHADNEPMKQVQPALPLDLSDNHLQYLHLSLKNEESAGVDLDESSDLLIFHEAINNLVESEEQLIEEHKGIIKTDQYLLAEETKLLDYVGEVDHDIEEYVTSMERIVSEKVERLSKFKERLQDLRQRLHDEECASKNIQRNPRQF